MQDEVKPVVILLVDDDMEDIYGTKRAFKQSKFTNEFRYVQNYEDLMEYLGNEGRFADEDSNPRPHIILLDINMPKKSGLEILEELRKVEKYKSIPIVMLTTSENENDIAESYGLGANSFITKPVTMEGMLRVVNDFESYWFQLVKIPNRK